MLNSLFIMCTGRESSGVGLSDNHVDQLKKELQELESRKRELEESNKKMMKEMEAQRQALEESNKKLVKEQQYLYKRNYEAAMQARKLEIKVHNKKMIELQAVELHKSGNKGESNLVEIKNVGSDLIAKELVDNQMKPFEVITLPYQETITDLHIDLMNFHIKQLKDKIEKYEKDSLYVEVYNEEKQVIRTQYSLEKRNDLILDRFYSAIVDVNDIYKDYCDLCKIYGWNCKLTCGHHICLACYNRRKTDLNEVECHNCHKTTYNITVLNSHQDIIGYKFIRVAKINDSVRVLTDVGAILTLQIPALRNNLYYSKIDLRWNPNRDGYLENTKYAAQKVIVLGVQFFGYDIKSLAEVVQDYHNNKCILVSDFDPQFQYVVGMIHEDVKAGFTGHDKCDCCIGLHFFKDKPSAVSYSHGMINPKVLHTQPLFTKRLDDVKENTPLIINMKTLNNVNSNVKDMQGESMKISNLTTIISSAEIEPTRDTLIDKIIDDSTLIIVGCSKKVEYNYDSATKRMVPGEVVKFYLDVYDTSTIKGLIPGMLAYIDVQVKTYYMDQNDMKLPELQRFIADNYMFFKYRAIVLPITADTIYLEDLESILKPNTFLSKLVYGNISLEKMRQFSELGYNPNTLKEEYTNFSKMLFRNKVVEVPNVSRNIKVDIDESKLIDPVTMID